MNAKIMGILNVTPDSFFDGGKYANVDAALKQFGELKKYSDIVDIGAESTRPGATPVSAEEEIIRLEPILKSILPEKNIEISIDTYHAKTAEFALKNGADIINSVDFDEETAKVVAKYGAKAVVMARDTGGKLENTVIALNNLINLAKKNGVEEKNIILDAGIGFIGGASADLLALKNLPKLKEQYKDFPVLIGASRKSFIGKVLNIEKNERMAGSLATHLYAAKNGADIVRAHDAKETKEALMIIDAIEG
ncbi:MAG: dihydropteroate synthase [Selenomonadaceae bacterium]|nr:dihydropteroate synthase [Selenomonadaceae bacterium]MBP3722376.1 dihydropteroate synthase [Selenomonadaceae bacterium]